MAVNVFKGFLHGVNGMLNLSRPTPQKSPGTAGLAQYIKNYSEVWPMRLIPGAHKWKEELIFHKCLHAHATAHEITCLLTHAKKINVIHTILKNQNYKKDQQMKGIQPQKDLNAIKKWRKAT